MSKFFWITLFFLATFSVAKSQESLTIGDTAQASTYFSEAKELLKNAKYDSSILIFKELVVFYEKKEMWEKAIGCLNYISENQWRQGNLIDSKASVDLAVSLCEKHFGENHLHMAIAYKNLAIINNYNSNIAKAKQFCLDALDILNKLIDKNEDIIQNVRSDINSSLGPIYFSLGESRAGLKILLNEFNLQSTSKKIDSIRLASSYSNVGSAYLSISHFDSALYFLQKGLSLTKIQFGNNHPKLIGKYYNISHVYLKMGRFKKALDYASTALEVCSKSIGIKSRGVTFIYSQIGNCYQNMKNFEKANNYHIKSLELAKEIYGENSIEVAQSYEDMGFVNGDLGEEDLATNYFNKALSIQIRLLGEKSNQVGNSYSSFGISNLKFERYDSAISNIRKALDIFYGYYSDRPYQIIRNNYTLGLIYQAKEEYDSSIYYFDKSIDSNVKESTIISSNSDLSIANCFSPLFLYYSINAKAISFSRSKQLENALIFYQKSDTLINQIRKTNLSFEDKLSMSEAILASNADAVNISMLLFEKSSLENYKYLAYSFNEKSKAAALVGSTSTISDDKNSMIPDSLRAVESSIKYDIEYYGSKIRENKAKNDSTSLYQIANYEDKLFALGQKRDSLESVIKENYPKYYQLNYENKVPQVHELQSKISDNTTLIEFMSTDSTLYTFLITKDKFEVFTSPIDTTFSNKISDFVEGVSKGPLSEDPNIAYTNYTKSAYEIYNKLIKKPLDYLKGDGIDNLMIVPSGKLSYLPFEILLMSDSSTGDYSTLDYLVKDYNISYGYSVKNIFQESNQNKSSSEQYLGYAPSYEGLQIDYEEHRDLEKFRSTLVDLNWNEFEVESAGKELGGQYFLTDQATETSFKENVENSNIVHLAMHALVDDENPMKSKLIFSQKNDSINDGFLHTYELFDLKINPELVVLSACNTGTGELEKGEGIISLAYGFAYAGCPSIISSLWQVNDKSTSVLMNHFYGLLSEGLSKGEALRQAKLTLIQDEGSLYAHPYFWSPFILVGNPEPIDQSIKMNWWYTFGLFLALVLVLGFYRLRRSDSA